MSSFQGRVDLRIPPPHLMNLGHISPMRKGDRNGIQTGPRLPPLVVRIDRSGTMGGELQNSASMTIIEFEYLVRSLTTIQKQKYSGTPNGSWVLTTADEELIGAVFGVRHVTADRPRDLRVAFRLCTTAVGALMLLDLGGHPLDLRWNSR